MPAIRTSTSPDEVLRRYYLAMNAGDADGALTLFADEAIRLDTATPDRLIKGKAQIGAGIRGRIADHIVIEATDYQVNGDQVTCFATVFTDYARRLGFAPVEEGVVVTVEDGLVTKFEVTVTQQSLERIRAAEAQQ